ncbi:SixA phosphatase family protein [Planctomicrobium sp. SH668]|uniref:SixA phosphatase family protein n=1 Tax=Planctomicrobium sp. SH668 TaxID=3448126 RepID=UPI003F5B335A
MSALSQNSFGPFCFLPHVSVVKTNPIAHREEALMSGVESQHGQGQLLLMRHAKSCWDNPDLDDHDRPLNERGRTAAMKMSRLLKRRYQHRLSIISSSALRAFQTATIIAAECEVASIEARPELYHADVAIWRRFLSTLQLHQTTIVIGHNPGLEELLQVVSQVPIRMPTGAIAVCELSVEAKSCELEFLRHIDTWRPKEMAD